MDRIRHILFPYDFSLACAQAVPHVRSLAERFDARVTLYSVVPPPHELALGGLGPRIGNDPVEWRRALQCRLDQQLRGDLATLCVDRVAAAGDVATKIVAYADEHAVDLIMMPTHGLGLFRSVIVGSTTLKVLHEARQPVWTAAHAERQIARHPPKAILCAVDGADRTVPLVEWAAKFSNDAGAAMTILHVQAREENDRTLEWRCKSTGSDAPFRAVVGEIVPTVCQEAGREGADLLIIGRGSASEPFARLRTHVFGIIQHSPCPVLSV
jgi:nucleotide-binding universal stress UspA family protein